MNTFNPYTKKLMQIEMGNYLNNKNNYEAYVTDHNNNSLTFPTSYYSYKKNTNTLFYTDFNNSYALRIPPNYQFLKVIQNNNTYSLSLCDINGKTFNKEDLIQTSNEEQDLEIKPSTNNPSNIPDNINIANIIPILKQNINLEEYYNQNRENLPSFFLSKLNNSTETSVHIFKLPLYNEQNHLDPSQSIGILNNEAAFFARDNNTHAKDYPYYFRYINADFQYIDEDNDPLLKIYAPPYVDANLLLTAENAALMDNPIYLIVDNGQFYFSNEQEGNTIIDDEFAIKILKQVNLIESPIQDHDNIQIQGKFTFKITKGKEIDNYYHGTVSKVNIALENTEIPLTSFYDTDHIFFNGLYFCHLREDNSKIMDISFDKQLDANVVIKKLILLDPIYVTSSNNNHDAESYLLINNTKISNIEPLTTLLSNNLKTYLPPNYSSTNDQLYYNTPNNNIINNLSNNTSNSTLENNTLNDMLSSTNNTNLQSNSITHAHYNNQNVQNNTESNYNPTLITNNMTTEQSHTFKDHANEEKHYNITSNTINHHNKDTHNILLGKRLDNNSHELIIKASYDEISTFYTNAINKYEKQEYTYNDVMTLFNYIVKNLPCENEGSIIKDSHIDSNNHIFINNNDFGSISNLETMFCPIV
ncbi:hypothetical protein [Candidatus Neoehrlichia procyonis]|uniref:Uncharacterized protein n=1 Tax=Candidatus Neoehrlichia procyonis str. RAC413 TaxID=1359163 RepID=A0A0F3NMF0_9RICK|nr:hypothetical protein [Candidatus Neoehrlichia lotoris]KJV69238.1 hypothetical protein NLO413_0619 [Candidatus Neoehrlichia lotoris str. RAC413]